jgi:dihydroneopterin aldolase
MAKTPMSRSPSFWDADASYERVALEDLEVELQVGIDERERVPGRTQRLLLTVEMFRHRDAFAGTSIADCLDYDRIWRHIAAHWTAARAHVDLLEQLLEEVVALCFEDTRVEACRVAIRKSEIYDGRAVPVVEVYRLRPATPPGA